MNIHFEVYSLLSSLVCINGYFCRPVDLCALYDVHFSISDVIILDFSAEMNVPSCILAPQNYTELHSKYTELQKSFLGG